MSPALGIKDMGPCEVVWNYGNNLGIALGPFLGATTYRGETNVQSIQEERYGDADVDAITIGTVATLELKMTRSTYEQLVEVLNAIGHPEGDPEDYEYITLKNQLGCEMYALAAAVVIKPICDNEVSDDPSEWVHIYKAYPVPGWELTWDRSTQRVFPVKFKIFVCQESPNVGEFGTIGMESGSTIL